MSRGGLVFYLPGSVGYKWHNNSSNIGHDHNYPTYKPTYTYLQVQVWGLLKRLLGLGV